MNRMLTSILLQRQGHTVTLAENGKKAVSLSAAGSFDLIFMDVQMPELDGMEATVAIRRQEAVSRKHTPIIALTAHAIKGDADRCLAAGMDAYLSKPIKPAELFSTISSFFPQEPTPAPIQAAEKGGRDGNEFDVEAFVESTGGDEAVAQQVCRLFMDQANVTLAEVSRAVEAQDGDALHRAAHALKGSAGGVYARRAAALASELETMGRTGVMAQAPERLRELEDSVRALHSAMTEFIERDQALRAPQRPRKKTGGHVAEKHYTRRNPQ